MNKNITEPRERDVICDDASQPNLAAAVVDTKDQGMLQREFYDRAGTVLGPISSREKIANGIHVEQARIGTDQKVILMGFEKLRHNRSLSQPNSRVEYPAKYVVNNSNETYIFLV